ncbi:hypothetical protein HDE_04316 [Halotydeus destructor]|nr:hypothetical protein HDE_04316 [Halotydeus destructor]
MVNNQDMTSSYGTNGTAQDSHELVDQLGLNRLNPVESTSRQANLDSSGEVAPLIEHLQNERHRIESLLQPKQVYIKARTRQDDAMATRWRFINQVLLITFTMGMICSLVGLLSLLEDVVGRRLFVYFYTTGSFFMSIIFLVPFKGSTFKLMVMINVFNYIMICVILIEVLFYDHFVFRGVCYGSQLLLGMICAMNLIWDS